MKKMVEQSHREGSLQLRRVKQLVLGSHLEEFKLQLRLRVRGNGFGIFQQPRRDEQSSDIDTDIEDEGSDQDKAIVEEISDQNEA